MIIPIEITYRGIQKTEMVDSLIREKTKKLERFCSHISSCRVAVESRQLHQRSGHPFRVRIDIKVPPGHEVVITRDAGEGQIHDELHAVIREAFDAAGRQLKSITEKQRGDTKKHPEQEAGALVARIFRDEGYGFIKTLDGREIYFHKNSVSPKDFDRLEVGTGVRYVEVPGDEGPQASTVQIVDKPGARIKEME